MNKKIYCLALGAVLGGMLVSCTNELNEPNNVPNQPGLLKVIKDPKVVAWSGDQVLKNTLPGTRAENANANEWADPNKEYGGWLVPDPLTDGQKERVRAYFQANPNLDYVDPHWNNFFVQQVYKGYDKPGDNSPEIYTSANGTTTSTSDNMNLMTVGQGEVHINNFNYGTATEVDVLNNGQSVGGETHKDQIMLMVDIDDTSCFGYHETNGSKHHNDKAALVAAAVIDAWAAENGNPGESVVDEWNRSFLGFDLELRTIPDMASNGYAKYQDGVQQPNYIWNGKEVIQVAKFDQSTNWQSVPVEGYEFLKGLDGNWLPFADTNENMYLSSDKVVLEQSEVKIDKQITVDTQWGPQQQNVACLNLEKIQPLIDQGYLPVKDKQLCEWVKVVGGDGYYSDWIVCLTEAKKQGDPDEGNSSNKPDNNVCDRTEECHDAGHPSHEGQPCPKCGDNEGCNKDDDTVVDPKPTPTPDPDPVPGGDEESQLPDGGSEVEVNLAINDDGVIEGNVNDLVAKLSIHVRMAGNVEVFIPISNEMYCDNDDLVILNKHEEGLIKHGGPTTVSYNVNGTEVTLTVSYEEDGIRVTTSGIDDSVFDYCREVYKDGINFEVYLYFNKTATLDDLKDALNSSTIKFIDGVYPDYYINAFTDHGDGEAWEQDCTVEIIKEQKDDYYEAVEGEHLNNSPYNKIYKNKSVINNPDDLEHNHDYLKGGQK